MKTIQLKAHGFKDVGFSFSEQSQQVMKIQNYEDFETHIKRIRNTQ